MAADVNGFIEKLNALPSPSAVLQKLNAIMADPASSADEITKIIRMDPSLSGKVLRFANSAYIGLPRAISSLQNAVVLLGHQRVRALLFSSLTFKAVPSRNPAGGFLTNFWRHSMTVALAAEAIAAHCRRYEALDTDDFFCAGMLHDIGKLVIFAFDPKRIERAAASSANLGMPFFTAEEQALDHTTVGGLLAARWNFPHSLACALVNHHTPQACPSCRRMNSIVNLSDAIAHIMGYSTLENEIVPDYDDRALEQTRLAPERIKVIAEAALRDEKRIEALLAFFEG
ncbi:MAG: HDOD domain-containing protein [Chitinivibrionales bacterium]|nr:HDOD domain-containing protein [Chitinivibrionales bacterium]